MLSFFAVPSWQLSPRQKNDPPPERLEPKLPEGGTVDRALAHSEFRDQKPWLRATALLAPALGTKRGA